MMHLHSLPEILNWKSIFAEFNGEVIDNILNQLRPQNAIVVYSCSDQLENPITEKHLGGKYIIKNLPQRKSVQEKFESLKKNPFLPLKTDLVPSTVKVPVRQDNIWFVQGDFNVCKGGVNLKVHRPESEIFIEFYADYLDLLLKEITYMAECLKLEVEFDADDQFNLKIFGFSQTVEKLIEEIAPLMGSIHKTK